MSKKPKDLKKLERFVIDQRELAQNDVQCILDGLDDEYVDRVCQVIVDRMNMIVNELK